VIGLGRRCENHKEMLEKDHKNNVLKYAKNPGQVLDNLMKDVVNKQSQFIRKVIGTYCKLLLPWILMAAAEQRVMTAKVHGP
jgi:hypothetical protein